MQSNANPLEIITIMSLFLLANVNLGHACVLDTVNNVLMNM